ncbi:unnamed protein product [Closterium sp. NIES-64]|nr:unnamed protein product [Closterium sp. NIES-64]
MAKRSDRAGNNRLLSLPDELLQIILGLADHPSDRRNVALPCSRLRRVSRRTSHALSFDLLLTSPELNSRYARARLSYTRQPPLPPVHLLPSLQSLSLLYVPLDYLFIPRCSSLTSLTLWAPESSSFSSLAFCSSSPLSSPSSSSLASPPQSPLRTALRSLSLEGVIDSLESLLPRAVSLDGLVGMLVRVESRVGEPGGEPGGKAGGKAGGAAGGEAKEADTDASEKAQKGASAAAAVVRVFPKGSDKQWGRYVDKRKEVLAAQEDKLAALGDVVRLSRVAIEASKAARSDALLAARVEGVNAVPRIVASLGKIRFGISACRSFCAGVREANAAIKWEEAVVQAIAAAAVGAALKAPGFLTTELSHEEAEDREGEETEVGAGSRGMDSILPGVMEELLEHTDAVSASFDSMRPLTPTLPRPVVDAAAHGGGAATPGGGDGAAAAPGGPAVREGRAAVHGERGGAAEASQRVESTLEGGGLGEKAADEAAAGEVAGKAAAGETAQGDAKPSSGKSSIKHSEGSHAAAAVPVQVFCPPLESLTLRSLCFASPPLVPWLPPSLSSESPRMYLSSSPSPPSYSCHSSSSSSLSSSSSPSSTSSRSSCAPSPSGPFESIARAAAFRLLKHLALVRCVGLKEHEWLELLGACFKLEELRVLQDSSISDAVVAGSRLGTLASLTQVECDKITATGVGGVLGSFSRLRYLKVEVRKVTERARREFLRAGVVVRGV